MTCERCSVFEPSKKHESRRMFFFLLFYFSLDLAVSCCLLPWVECNYKISVWAVKSCIYTDLSSLSQHWHQCCSCNFFFCNCSAPTQISWLTTCKHLNTLRRWQNPPCCFPTSLRGRAYQNLPWELLSIVQPAWKELGKGDSWQALRGSLPTEKAAAVSAIRAPSTQLCPEFTAASCLVEDLDINSKHR